MRKSERKITLKAKKILAIFLIVVMIGTSGTVLFKPKPAEAQCVCGAICTLAGGGIGRAIDVVMNSQIVVEIYNTYSTLTTLYDSLTAGFNGVISGALQTADNNLNEYLDAFVAYDLIPMMQDWTAQGHAINVATNQQINTMMDGRMQARTIGELQNMESEAARLFRPNQNACVGGTLSGGLTRGRVIARGLERSLPLQHIGAGGNVLSSQAISALQNMQQQDANLFPGMDYYTAQVLGTGGQYCSQITIQIEEDDYLTAAGSGNAMYQTARQNNYYERYCNPQANGGTGCPNGAGANVDGDILVLETLFERDTIDIRQPERLQSVNDLVVNLIEPEVPNIIPPTTFNSPDAQEEILGRRAFRARRVLAKKAVYDTVARRAPGTRVGPYVETLRLAAGVGLEDISENPSLNEVINAMAGERFWTGTYNLGNVQGPAQVNHEKLTLQAVELMQLSDYLDQLNNLSLLLATQVANETVELGDAAGRF